MKVALYARYSTDNQRDASIADQFRVCRAFADKQGWHVVQEYSDHAISGASLLRTGVQALIAGGEHNLANQGTQCLGCLAPAVRVVERFGNPHHVPVVDIGDVRMNIGDVGGSLRETFGDLRLLPLKFVYPRLHRRLV